MPLTTKIARFFPQSLDIGEISIIRAFRAGLQQTTADFVSESVRKLQ
ncbi:hypothetical protein A0J48_020540 [Sphaerospermopsis aphanizomenoides BCCUSP55]|nr:hypothetical protein [Sphaerospermopsis aphanizomenoides BCCUSP55]